MRADEASLWRDEKKKRFASELLVQYCGLFRLLFRVVRMINGLQRRRCMERYKDSHSAERERERERWMFYEGIAVMCGGFQKNEMALFVVCLL